MNELLSPARSFEDIPPAEFIEFGEIIGISLSSSTNGLTHGIHRYPAKYIPQIPRWAIREYSDKGDLVVDPFSGSGTTTLEAIAQSRNGAGVDLDPLACLIAEAKVTPVSPERLERLMQQLLVKASRHPGQPRLPLPDIKNFGHWFSQDAWSSLQSIRNAIAEIEASVDERRFMLTIFSSILRAVSNADDQSQKTYVSGTLKKTPPPVIPTFEKSFRKALAGVSELASLEGRGLASIYNQSATDLPFNDKSVDLIVTSPPYLDSVDYMYNMMLEYFWLGADLGIDSRREFNARRRSYIGAKNAPSQALPDLVKDLVDENEVPTYRRDVLGPYFSAMDSHFAEAARVLKDGGRYVLVVGNSRTKGEMLPLHDALNALASTSGLLVEHAFGYRVRRHYMKFPRKGRGGIILMDWVITLRKGAKAVSSPTRLPMIDGQLHPDAVAH